ncbi:hypothetical protein Dsin_002015 [Dipteronia sinensis]|uniref:No apical meristem-associated C-terminal domain-containing protein n=1 Tax=Dipteronia sinensis TaxID=43782 RepID=A0AAE0B6Q8_9ROSI|nr:hypothetical protein Dsin_002015 [Dipteronia sinensis]
MKVHLDTSQNPIIGTNKSNDMFWSRVEIDYNNTKPENISAPRGKRSLQCRMQTILSAVGKLRGYIRHIESLNPSGASEADIVNNDTAISAFRRQSGHFVSSQEDSPTPESPTTASSALSSFFLNITNDDIDCSLSQRSVGLKKAKLKRRVEEESSKLFDTMQEGQQQLIEVLKKRSQQRQINYDIMKRKLDAEEAKIVMMDLNTITDPN